MSRTVAKYIAVSVFCFATLISFLPAQASDAEPQRIVSMAPSVTEILFALGVGERVVGVTRHSIYPPQVDAIPRVGGYLDPNYEAILVLKPDIVITFSPNHDLTKKLNRLGLNTLHVDHESVPGIVKSITTIGKACGAQEQALKLIDQIENRLEKIKRAISGVKRPTVLVSASRIAGTGHVRGVYVAGRGTYLNDIIKLAGGVNAFTAKSVVAYPRVSGEGLISLNPDYIIDMIPTLKKDGLDEKDMLAEWEGVAPKGSISAGRVHVFGLNHMVIPGPRFVDTVERFARAIHPEVEWK